MGFHYGMEKRKFDKEWEQLEQEYRAAGMTEEQIAAMWEYDWAWFCSQRIFGNRTQALPSEQYEDGSEQSRLFQNLILYLPAGMSEILTIPDMAGCPLWRMKSCFIGYANCPPKIWSC